MYDYSYDNLKRIIQTKEGEDIFNRAERLYKKTYANKPVNPLSYSDYKLVYKNGDRIKYETAYFDRVTRLAILQVLALKDDNYLDDLEEVLSSICDCFTWVLPAHNLNKDNTFDYTVIDLFSGEVALYLSETVYVLGDKLSADIKNRIKISIKSKIVDNFESRTYFWETCSTNWAAVCACGTGLAYLYLFPERFSLVKARIFSAMENFVGGISCDGVVDEGAGYWQYGFGMFAVFFDVYVQLTGERPAILDNPKIKKTLEFMQKAYLGNGEFLPFADGGQKGMYCNYNINYAIKNLFGDDYVMPPCKDVYALADAVDRNYHVRLKAYDYRLLNGINKFGKFERKDDEVFNVYYKSSEWFIDKNAKYAFVAKCGHNCEKHNHNDIGCFALIAGGERVISDLGAGMYTWEYFNDRSPENGRYSKKIFTCGSWSHSVPVINGEPQVEGRRGEDWKGDRYCGKVIEVGEKKFKVDIARAYRDGAASSVIVEYLLKENGIDVNYACKDIKNDISFRFITEEKPLVTDGGVKIGCAILKSKSGILPTVEEYRYAVNEENDSIAYAVDFFVGKDGDVNESFCIELG